MPSLDQISGDLPDALAVPIHEQVATHDETPVHHIDIRALTVRVDGRDAALLSDISVELHRGEMIGVLGPSGAGKTTLVSALLGFVPAESGMILINGDQRVTKPADWGGRAAVVPQDVVILDASLRENVAFGLGPDDIDDARVLSALRQAHLEGLLAELADGTDTVLGEAGARMSGGQRQRLGIARALYHDADVLVFDESTAGLDFDTEQRILATLDELKADRIIVLVSHHRPVMEYCDRLLVLEAGRLVGTGPITLLQDVLGSAGLGVAGLSGDGYDAPRAIPAPSR